MSRSLVMETLVQAVEDMDAEKEKRMVGSKQRAVDRKKEAKMMESLVGNMAEDLIKDDRMFKFPKMKRELRMMEKFAATMEEVRKMEIERVIHKDEKSSRSKRRKEVEDLIATEPWRLDTEKFNHLLRKRRKPGLHSGKD